LKDKGQVMNDERANFDASADAPRRGPSRRQMIKASAVAGAAAWTAPVIIDSLSSPAAAASGCTGDKYYMKLVGRGSGAGSAYDPGDCYNAAPLCNNTTKYLTGGNAPDSTVCSQNDNYTWVCTSGSPPNNHTGKFRSSFVDSNPGHPNSGTYTVTLAANCTFQSGSTNYTAVANYNWTGSGGECQAVATTNGSNQVVFNKSISSGSKVLDYMYLEFVCV
jgi:hypothetical protein